jgi:hypothetical protein
MVITDVHNELRLPGSGCGGNLGEWVGVWIVTILEATMALQAASRVADHDDASYDRGWYRQWLARN